LGSDGSTLSPSLTSCVNFAATGWNLLAAVGAHRG
jgi:hypothetical protein